MGGNLTLGAIRNRLWLPTLALRLMPAMDHTACELVLDPVIIVRNRGGIFSIDGDTL